MFGTRSLLAALFLSAAATSAASTGPLDRSPAEEESGATAEAVATLDETSARSASGDLGSPASIRAAASSETAPARGIEALHVQEEPMGSGPSALYHGGNVVIGTGTLIVILLVLILVT
ncbi:MAG TPA: hypothetical protein VKU85_06460 [bacterium]|nr:hypothetical protein [bacterium]